MKEDNLETIKEEPTEIINKEIDEEAKTSSEEDEKSLFPDTQIKLDLSGPKYVN